MGELSAPTCSEHELNVASFFLRKETERHGKPKRKRRTLSRPLDIRTSGQQHRIATMLLSGMSATAIGRRLDRNPRSIRYVISQPAFDPIDRDGRSELVVEEDAMSSVHEEIR